MSNPTSSPSGTVGRGTAFVLGLIVFACVTLIGASGYLKYRLDKAEAVITAPEATQAASEKDATDKLRRLLGYSGFIGSAQSFLSTRSHEAVAEMKADAKQADEMIARLPEKTPPEVRHDLQSIQQVFAAAALKAEAAPDANGFTPTDMAPLYGALPVLDARVAAAASAGQLAAQNEYSFWATALTLVAWASLIIAAALAAGIYLSLRSRNAAPLRALAQSVQNMGRGDMRTPIWGMERSDMVGEVARAVDLARYHFSQLPDVALMSDQGPVRLRFEGNARSLFEAMMQNITKESEQIRAQVQGLAGAIERKNEAIALTAANVESALSAILRNRQAGEEQIEQLLKSVSGSAGKLNSAQEIASSRLNGLVTYLQERAKSMGDLTQIAGKQMAQSLLSLGHTEKNLRESADQSRETVQKLAAAAEEIGERLFGAVTLLRAGGKALTEATESTQSRLNEAINLLSQSEGSLRQMLAQGFTPVGSVAVGRPAAENAEMERLLTIVGGIETAQRKLEECLSQQALAAQAQIDLLATQSSSLLTQASTAAQTLVSATDHLRDERDRLGATTGKMGEALEYLGARLEQRAMESFGKAETALQGLGRLTELSAGLGPVIEKLSSTVAANAAREDSGKSTAIADSLMNELKAGFEVTSRSIERLREEFLNLALQQPPATAGGAAPGQWDHMTAQIEEARESLTRLMIQQADRLEVHLAGMDKRMPLPAAAAVTEIAQSQLQQQTQILTELATALGAIDAHMQEMETSFKNLSAAAAAQRVS